MTDEALLHNTPSVSEVSYNTIMKQSGHTILELELVDPEMHSKKGPLINPVQAQWRMQLGINMPAACTLRIPAAPKIKHTKHRIGDGRARRWSPSQRRIVCVGSAMEFQPAELTRAVAIKPKYLAEMSSNRV